MTGEAIGWQAIWASGPSEPPCLADGPGALVEADIAAPPAAVWAIVTDISFGADRSEEFLGARWEPAAPESGRPAGPALGAVFVGRNRHPAIGEWEVRCFVHRYLPEREFGWVTTDPDHPGAQWWFSLTPTPTGTRLAYRCRIGPGPSGLTPAIERMPDKEPRILERRVGEHGPNMVRVVEAIRRVAERSTPAGTWRLSNLVGTGAGGRPETSSIGAGDRAVTMTIGSDGTVSGSDGCNRFMGTSTGTEPGLDMGSSTSSGRAPLRFGPLASTRMACEPVVMARAEAFARALEHTAGWSVEGTTLSLYDAAGAVLASFTRV